jgi:DNA polymerase bacteriophage-type
VRYLVLDYETRSEADIKKSGSYEYARDHSTRILCLAYRLGTREALSSAPIHSWSAAEARRPAEELADALSDSAVRIVAHNAFFEQVITRFVLSRIFRNDALARIPPKRWVCTASLARALALPGKLEGAAEALRLPFKKDAQGHRLMLKMSKPRRPTKKDPSLWHEKKSDLARLLEYCRADVRAETALFLRLPPLIPAERKLWCLDQRINLRGFRVDRPLVLKSLNLLADAASDSLEETAALTGGEIRSTAQRDATLKFLAARGTALPDLRARTVEDRLKAGIEDDVSRRLLEIRSDSAKTSTAKYAAFERRSRTDSRVRDSLLYHGASTGRWSGAGVAPQNFPRGSVADTGLAAAIISDPATDLAWIRTLYGRPLDVLSSCLRAAIIPTKGFELFGGDYAAIELRVLFWIARHERGLRALRTGRDLYKELARKIYGRLSVDEVTKPEREVGKRAILGCGYSMGAAKFFITCENQGQPVSIDLARAAVEAYRSEHTPVPRLWYNIERAAIAAVKERGKRFTVNRTTWWVEDSFLWCALPSERRLAYYRPEIRMKRTPWGEMKPELFHYGVNPVSKKWEISSTYGGRLVENVVQATARDLMAAAMPRLERAGYRILLSVHDELLTEREEGRGCKKEFQDLMASTPSWARDCPVTVESWSGSRYRK